MYRVDPKNLFCNVCNGGTMIFLIHLRSKIPSYSWTFVFVLILLATTGQLVHCLHCCACCIFGPVVGSPHLANPSIYWRNVLTRTRPYCGDSLMLQWCSMCLGNVIVKYSKCNLKTIPNVYADNTYSLNVFRTCFADVTVLSSSFLRALLVSEQTIRLL